LAGARKKMHWLQTSPVSWLSGDEFLRYRRWLVTAEIQETRSLPVAALRLQWLASVNPPYSRAAATDLHRLPEHEVCGESGGAWGPLVVDRIGGKTKPPGWGEQESSANRQTKELRAAFRKKRVQQRAAPGKPVRVNRAETRWPEARRGDTSLSGGGQPGQQIHQRDSIRG
jgi:hypothetical protein